jgi:membrane fusion protein (multidrug efflux system)
VTLQQLDPIYVDFPVPEQEAARVRVGQKIEARVDAYPDQPFAGTIRSIEPRVSAETRSLPIRAEIANADRRLLPGMFANVAVEVGEPRDLVTVARTAITYSLYGDSIFVAVKPKDGPEDALVAERRFVRLGDTRGDRVSVVEGVKEGEMVVTSGQLKLNPNARIRIDNSAPLTPQRPPPKL